MGQGHPLWLKTDGVPQVAEALHPLVGRERHRTPAATSFAVSQRCERTTGQDRTGRAVTSSFRQQSPSCDVVQSADGLVTGGGQVPGLGVLVIL